MQPPLMHQFKMTPLNLFGFLVIPLGFLMFANSINFSGCEKLNSYFKKLDPPQVFLAEPDGKCAPKLENCVQDTIFYSYDGSCNNLEHSYFGQVGYPFERILPANFADGFDLPRVSIDGSPLPLPRVIRTTILPNGEYRAKDLNSLFFAFGQFNNHDTSLQTPIKFDEPCCDNGKPVNPTPYECSPTIMPDNDEFYSQFGITCMDLKRSTNTKYLDCPIKPIRQINYDTAFFDLSILYGGSEERAKKFRKFEFGLLKAEADLELPYVTSGTDDCPRGGLTPGKGDSCFFSGRERVNQNPGIFSINVLFFRLHNYLAKELFKINQLWDDEYLYQVARRICIAMYQQVIGAEFAPALIGSDAASIYNLYPASGYMSGYDSSINPQTFHEFTAAAGRSGHSTVRGSFNYRGSQGREEFFQLRDKYFTLNFLLSKEVFLGVVQAFTFSLCDEQDQYFTKEVNNYLLPPPGSPFGNDLSTIDIGRGREFGLEFYNRYREICGLKKLLEFEDLADEIFNPSDIDKLRSLYRHVDDIDLYVGGMMEKPYKDSTMGPTFTCIVGAQYYQWKFGDRKFFEFPTAKFTETQLQVIHSITFAQLLCLTVPQLERVPKNAFYIPSDSRNSLISCQKISHVELSPWKE